MKPKKHSCYKTYVNREEFKPSQRLTTLQCDDGDDPPMRLTESFNDLCTISCDFGITYDTLDDKIGKTGKSWKQLIYEIEMIPSGASNVFSVLHKGKRMGSRARAS